MKNKVLSVLLCLCLMVGVIPAVAPVAKAAGNPYGKWQTDDYGRTTVRCTWYAWEQVYANHGISLPGWGNASTWLRDARNSGFSTGTEPRVGSLAVWESNGWGHVAYVTAVNNGSIVVNEGGSTDRRADKSPGNVGIFVGHTVPDPVYDSGELEHYWPSGYIYISGSSTPPTSSYPTDIRVFNEDNFFGRIYYPAGDKYLENRNGNVQLANYDSTDPRQIWTFKREGNAYILRNLYDGRNFDSATGQGSGANVGVWEDNGDAAQRWYFYRDAGGKSDCFNIASSFDTSLVVDVDNASTHAGANVQAWFRNATVAQAFQVFFANDVGNRISRDIGTGFYAQISYNGTYLQTTGVEADGGMDVRTTRTSRPYDAKQIWYFTRNYNGSYKIKNMYSGWCLDVQTGIAEKGKNVWTWHEDHGDLPEQWYLVNSPGETKYRFVTALGYPNSMFSMDVYQGKTDENTNVTIFSPNEAAHQQFTITKVNYSTATPTPKPTEPSGPVTPLIEDPASAGDIEYGEKLSDSLLISGRVTDGNGNIVPGTWSWQEPNTVPSTGEYPAIFTPADRTKYNVPAPKNINVIVAPTKPFISLSAPSSQTAGAQVSVSAEVTNPHNPNLSDAPSANITYAIGNGTTQNVSGGKFSIPKDTPAGTVITVTAKTIANNHYLATEKSTSITVNGRGITQITGVTVRNAIYNGQSHAGYTGTPYADGAAVKVTYSGRDGTSYSSSAAPKNAGSYTVTFTADNGASQGKLSLDFIIRKASITIRADSKNVPVGGRLPELTYTVTGLAGNDQLAVRPQISCVGQPDLSAPTSYVIRASGAKVPSGGNYDETITYIDGILSVYPDDEPTPPPTPTPGPGEKTEIFFKSTKQYLTPGKTLELVVLDSSAEPYPGQLEWWSDNENVAKVDDSGRVTALKNGSAVIRAGTTDGKYTASCEIVVGPWYQRAVDYVMQNGLMSGYGNGSFGANDRLSRAQLAQILYNKEGRPAVTITDRFSDIQEDAWYSKAVSWAAERKIVSGYSNGKFGHGDSIIRQDLAVMLWRYAGSPDPTEGELKFSDADKASNYALTALRWAAENKIMSGSGGKLNPRGYATRAEAAQMLMNFFSTAN